MIKIADTWRFEGCLHIKKYYLAHIFTGSQKLFGVAQVFDESFYCILYNPRLSFAFQMLQAYHQSFTNPTVCATFKLNLDSIEDVPTTICLLKEKEFHNHETPFNCIIDFLSEEEYKIKP